MPREISTWTFEAWRPDVLGGVRTLVAGRVILIRRRRIRGRGCGGGTARHRRHTGADRDAGGNTAPVGAVIATAAERDVAVDINVTAYVAVRRDVTVGRYVALKIGAVEIAPVDVAPVDVGAVDIAPVDIAATATTLHEHQRRALSAARPSSKIESPDAAPSGWRGSRCVRGHQREGHDVDQ